MIGVNRTSDQSEKVLSQLQEHYGDNLLFESVDFIDKATDGPNPEFQNMAYAYLSEMAIRRGNVDDLMFIDVDEYWTPVDFKTSISEHLDTLPYYDVVSYDWMLQEADPEPFQAPFKNTIVYTEPGLDKPYYVKSLLKTKSADRVEFFGPHRPKIDQAGVRLNSNGSLFEPLNKGFRTHAPKLKRQKAFLLHRIKRSETEYLASQQRPTFRQIPGQRLKPKTNFYRNEFVSSVAKHERLPFTVDNNYYRSLNQLIARCNLGNILNEERARISRVSEQVLPESVYLDESNIDTYLHKLFGTSKFDELVESVSESCSPQIKARIQRFIESKGLSFDSK